MTTDTNESITDEVSFTDVFRNKDFTKLLTGQFFSNLGDALFRICLLLYVFDFTGSIFTTTIVLSVQIIPWIIVGPISGVFADRISRKAIMIFSDVLRAISILMLIFIDNIFGMIIISFLVGVAASSFAAPRSAAIPEITGMKLYVKAISVSQLLFQSMAVVGPIFGAFVYVLFGKYSFIIIGISFVISAVFILAAIIPSAADKDDKLSLKVIGSDLKAGISYLLREPIISKLIILFGVLTVGSAFAASLIYPFIFENLYDGLESQESAAQKEYGLIGAFTALGMIVGNLVFGKYEHIIGRRFAIIVGSLAIGVYLIVFYFVETIFVLYLISLGFGFVSGLSNLAINAVFAETVPNEIRGRAYSATISYMMTFNAIATFLSGFVAEQFSTVTALAGCGVVMFIFVLYLTISTKFLAFTLGTPIDQSTVELSTAP